MLGYEFLNMNDKGNLTISGCDCTELAAKYGTPLYVMDEDEIRKRCRDIKKNHIDKYNGFAVYASKTFINKEMCRIVGSEGLGLDVVSGESFILPIQQDFRWRKLCFMAITKHMKNLKWQLIMESEE
jgi:diaminopimelate decarboxylase